MLKKLFLFFFFLGTLFLASGRYLLTHPRLLSDLVQVNTSIATNQNTAAASAAPAVLGVQTKSSNCVAQGPYPDPACTPGAIFPQATRDQICVQGYSQTVRNVSVEEKQAVYAAYGIATHSPGEYEVDHFVSLELGGSNDISNLWPEAAAPQPGFHQKDAVENYLHDQVCSGHMSLQDAQNAIRGDWLKVYQQAGL